MENDSGLGFGISKFEYEKNAQKSCKHLGVQEKSICLSLVYQITTEDLFCAKLIRLPDSSRAYIVLSESNFSNDPSVIPNKMLLLKSLLKKEKNKKKKREKYYKPSKFLR